MNSSLDDKEIIKFEKGDIIFIEGEPSEYLYIIIKGIVQTLKEEEFRLIPIGYLREKEFIGVIDVFENRPYSITAYAFNPTELLKIKKDDIQSLVKKSPLWLYQLLLTLSGRLRGIQDLVADHKLLDHRLYIDEDFTQENEILLKQKMKDFEEQPPSND